MDEYEICGIKCKKPNGYIRYWTGKDGDIKIMIHENIYHDLDLNPHKYFDICIDYTLLRGSMLSSNFIARGHGETFEEAKQNLEAHLKEKYVMMRRLMPRIM